MSVLSGPIVLTGGVGIKPMIKYMLSTDSMTTITTAGYLNNNLTNLGTITETDLLLIRYNYVSATNAGTNAFFNVDIASNGSITLSEDIGEGNVVLPTIANRIATYVGTNGQITDDAATAINGGNLQAGLSGTAGTLASFPGTAAKGSLKIAAVANTGDTLVTLSNAAHGQASVYSIPDVGAATGQVNVVTGALTSGNMMSASGTAGKLADSGVIANRVLSGGFATPDTNANLVSFDVAVTAAELAVGASKTLYASSGGKQYQIRNLWINSGGTNFSGGGGDRNFQITDGTAVYSVIPAASMTTTVNRTWSSTAEFPFPASTAINTTTVGGASLVMKYSGGATDWAAGSVTISGILQRVA